MRVERAISRKAVNEPRVYSFMKARADEAVYHVDTGEIDPLGNVTARPERRR